MRDCCSMSNFYGNVYHGQCCLQLPSNRCSCVNKQQFYICFSILHFVILHMYNEPSTFWTAIYIGYTICGASIGFISHTSCIVQVCNLWQTRHGRLSYGVFLVTSAGDRVCVVGWVCLLQRSVTLGAVPWPGATTPFPHDYHQPKYR